MALSTSTFLLRFRLSLRVPDVHNLLFPMALSLLPCIMALSIISLNVNGMWDQSKRLGLVQWLRSLPVTVDVVCLQETHCTSDSECSSWLSSSGFSCAVSPGSVKSCGCIVLYRPILSLVNSWCDPEGRFLQCEFSLRAKTFRVVCLYAPNRNPARGQFFDDVSSRVDPTVPTVLCGDFNTVFDRALDRSGSAVDDTSCESNAALSRLFDSCCAIDIWRYLHPSSSCFAWSRWNGQFSSRIDLIGCPYVWVSSVSSCDVLPCPFSDHCAFLFVLMFRMSFHLVQAFGNSTSLFSKRRSMSPSFLISGLPGAGASHLSRRWPSGGRKEKARSKASPSRIAPAALKGPPSPRTF